MKKRLVGIEIIKNSEDVCIITKVNSNSRAFTSGLRKGDIIVKVGDISLEGFSCNMVRELIHKKSGNGKVSIMYFIPSTSAYFIILGLL